MRAAGGGAGAGRGQEGGEALHGVLQAASAAQAGPPLHLKPTHLPLTHPPTHPPAHRALEEAVYDEAGHEEECGRQHVARALMRVDLDLPEKAAQQVGGVQGAGRWAQCLSAAAHGADVSPVSTDPLTHLPTMPPRPRPRPPCLPAWARASCWASRR